MQVVVALDRQEVTNSSGDKSAIEVLAAECGIQVVSVASLKDLITYVGAKGWS